MKIKIGKGQFCPNKKAITIETEGSQSLFPSFELFGESCRRIALAKNCPPEEGKGEQSVPRRIVEQHDNSLSGC